MIDILMATYNGEKYIAEQLNSIISQTNSSWRLIIQDDCSTDSTVDIIKSYITQYPSKILLYQNERNTGSAGLNFFDLLYKANSEYIMFCDQDDVWKPSKIELSLKKMQALEKLYPSSPVLVHTDLEVVDENLNTISNSMFKLQHLNSSCTSVNRLAVQNIITGCTLMLNRPLANLLTPHPQHIAVHDWWIGLVASIFGKIGFVDTPTIFYRKHTQNLCGAQDMESAKYIINRAKQTKRSKRMLTLGYRQAAELLNIYGSALPSEQYAIIKAYSQMESYSKLKKFSTLCKYNIWKTGIVRKIGQLWYM